MLTLFATPKPFEGHIGVIQRNAIRSWKAIHLDVEILLFGDEPGAAECCAEFGLVHIPEVERNETGNKYVRGVFGRAQQMARHDVLCHVNCDILLPPDFLPAVMAAAGVQAKFLMVARRWDLEITQPLEPSPPVWRQLQQRAASEGLQRGPEWIDLFAFRRGLYAEIPPLVIGRIAWDNWLVWNARAQGAAVVDASEVLQPIHQNHDYGYHPQGATGVWNDAIAARNRELAGGPAHIFTMEDATHFLTSHGLRRNWICNLAPWRRAARALRSRAWFWLLGTTRPVRHALGLRAKASQGSVK